ncbi:MAG: hypothetical protein IKQ93_09400 [Candidatus Methanomethylophilaceae archaeon]|nr:hypothetical protein [Candidatus Methanomethylophilaceae archaeon]
MSKRRKSFVIVVATIVAVSCVAISYVMLSREGIGAPEQIRAALGDIQTDIHNKGQSLSDFFGIEAESLQLIIGCIIAVSIIAILLMIVFRSKKIRLDLGCGHYVFVPDGWKSESISVIYRRFKKGDELVIPKVDARMGGATVIGWLPDPPKEVEKSETFKAVWSSQNDL